MVISESNETEKNDENVQLAVIPNVYCSIPPVDIIGALMIVWRVRGKIIRSVLCSIVHNYCAHTYEQT